MGHRQLSNKNPMPEADNSEVWNHTHPPQPFHTGSSSSVIPVENSAVSGLSTTPYFNPTLASNDCVTCSSSNIRPHVNVTGFSHYPYHLQSASEFPVHFPSNYSQHSLPSCIRKANHRDGHGSMDPLQESGRCHPKARMPVIGMVYDTSNINGYYPGRSPDVSSFEHLHQMQVPHSRVQPWDRTMNSNYKGKRQLTSGEGSHRNVRPRFPNGTHFDYNQGGTHPSINLSNNLQVTRGNAAPSILGLWNLNSVSLPSDRGYLSSVADVGCTSHGTNQPGSSGGGGFAGTGGRCHQSHIIRESLNVPLPVAPSDGRDVVSNDYGQSTNQINGSRPSYPPARIASSVHYNGRLDTEGLFRHSVPLPFTGGVRSRERHGRMRMNSYGRIQQFPDVYSANSRWMPEVMFSIDRSSFHDARSFRDQHRDMRLDIDNMSYEELLALEERIGTVNTGLSDDMILKCVTRIIYGSRDQVLEREDGNCVICLENFKDGAELGFLKCSHGYHVSCIKQWLRIKNACPICKSPALEK